MALTPLEQSVRAAAESLHVPGQENWLVIGPLQVEAIAFEQSIPRWQVEVAALEAEVVPLRYMRNLARYGIPGQINLLRTAVTVVGSGAPIRKCLQILAAYGIGRLRVLTPVESADNLSHGGPGRVAGTSVRSSGRVLPPEAATPGASASSAAAALAGLVTNQNASLETSAAAIDLRRGDPVSLLGEPDIVVACLEDATEEMLLQAASKRRAAPLVLGAIQDKLAQATTILPGDPGVALIYQADHPHLDRHRPGSLRNDGINGMAVGSWLADQVIALRLGLGEVLHNKLLYADIGSGEMLTFPLGR